jgi:hypothetical protein
VISRSQRQVELAVILRAAANRLARADTLGEDGVSEVITVENNVGGIIGPHVEPQKSLAGLEVLKYSDDGRGAFVRLELE